MKKFMADLHVAENVSLNTNYFLLKLWQAERLPEMLPGQFVQVLVEGSSTTFLRRPISINYVDRDKNQLWLLIQKVGEGTQKMSELKAGDIVNLMYPLGNTFTLPSTHKKADGSEPKILLIGGGVGIAPMLFLGSHLKAMNFSVNFLLGARSCADLLQLEDFDKFGKVYTTTEDGSAGEKGYVSQHSLLKNTDFDFIYTCGPQAMMHVVAAFAKQRGIFCEVSLENMMACGIGACLCCVENTTDGHICACTDGPVINIKKLKWQI
ncbi:dihydroorotate dehydrogenase B (NAD(+)), electron transfer subunit [Bacteroidales bacterium]|nr:dihydroorotate dehydrogenase B (NAD(+)), electron transfer subunit [Bacteroidales bacterium]